jgi:putative addiction module component (TIGR02574 family)
MSKAAAEILKAALRLGERERSELVDRIQDSLDSSRGSDIDAMTEVEFEAEIKRRHEEYLRDPSVGIPWEDVKRPW